MSDETFRLAEDMAPAPRERAKMLGHTCEHEDCGRLTGWGFARPHWFCFEHRTNGDRYL